ncbi:MAG: hypothetical protein C0448_15285 [Sphingobacteriaceae bacterium]|nr:hypothetical protein [Sphingobacteriaceae bacterium]
MKTKIFIAVFALFATLVSCKKAEKGDMGPAGPAGANGTNGNANVKILYFGKDSITTTRTSFYFSLSNPAVTSNMLDSSAVLVYHLVDNNAWYTTPGLGLAGYYESRFYTYSASKSLYISVYDPDGTPYTGPQVNILKFKVVLIPSSDYKGSRKKPVDFNDYYATMNYYGLPLD